MIYFLQPTGGGPIKIGFSDDVDRRWAQLESHYGQPLALLATMPGGRDEEAEIHRRFADLRLGRTEQFRPGADLMAFLGRPIIVDQDPELVEAMPQVGTFHLGTLHGSQEQADWLDSVNRKTHIAKSVIMRLALSEWASRNGHPPFPTLEDDQ